MSEEDTEIVEDVVETEEAAEQEQEESPAEESSFQPLEMSDEEFETAVLENIESTETVEEKAEAEEPQEETEEEEEVSADTETEEQSEEVNEEVSEEPEEAEQIDFEAQHNALLKPFKANGKEISISSVEEARTLMQMGANYHKKMTGLKPNLRILKMLENNDLLDEGKLNYLIDLDKKNPAALTKLVKESGLDVHDIDTDEKIDYNPNNYTVNDKEVELDETLGSIRDTDSYSQTLNIISKEWDATSKQMLLDNPAAIKVLNDHVQSGIYTKIAAAVETQRMLGQLPSSMSDLDAYKTVGDAINANGGFNSSQSKSAAPAKTSTTTKKVVDPKLSKKKKAASSTSSSARKKANNAFNPLSLSDEEFSKLAERNFM